MTLMVCGGQVVTDLRIVKIATHYGLEHQKRKLVEEMAELTQDIMKEKDIVEELVDVEIVLEQLKFLLMGNDEVKEYYTNMREYKIERQLERMKKEVI